MILDEIVLDDFGVYRGRQRLDLTPRSEKKPIILIGGFNGLGKTTLLDAMQLALYGRAGSYSSRRDASYEDFLRRSINAHAKSSDGAAIELRFRHAHEGVEHSYEVRRSWSIVNGNVRESFDASCDGRRDNFLIEHWDEYIEDLLPSRIAPLFFFDGEKIEELADVERSPILLKVAIQALLGLDIVQRLQTDLTVLQRRKRSEISSESDRSALEQAQRELATFETRIQTIQQAKATANTELSRAEKKLADARQAFRENGGELFEHRETIAASQTQALAERERIEARLRASAGGTIPLLLLRKQFEKISDQDVLEQKAAQEEAVTSTLTTRDKWLMKLLTNERIGAKTLTKVSTALEQERRTRSSLKKARRYINLSDEGRALFIELRGRLLDSETQEVSRDLQAFENILEQLTEIDRQLAAVPNEERIKVLAAATVFAEGEVKKTQDKHAEFERELAELQTQSVTARRKLAVLVEKEVDVHHHASDAARIISYVKRTQGALEKFETQVVRHHLEHLQDLVMSSLRALLRKKDLIERVEIDPQTFELVLLGKDLRAVRPERLSAGERQLLAVSLLWALAKASGRPIPTVVDTPLGRLDATHRANLVERYFPKASHQVILLSTDQEIDAVHYKKLAPSISHAYTLNFDPAAGGTKVVDGFAFAEG